MLSQVDHVLRRGLAALQEVVDDPGGNKMLLVMDYMEGGPVLTREGLERGRRIPEPLALQYFRDMCKVCSHAMGSIRHSWQSIQARSLQQHAALCPLQGMTMASLF